MYDYSRAHFMSLFLCTTITVAQRTHFFFLFFTSRFFHLQKRTNKRVAELFKKFQRI